MSDDPDLVRRLRRSPSHMARQAADVIDALTARVAQLEACLTDVKEQLEMRGIRE